MDKLKILLVDDSSSFRESIADYLRFRDFDVTEAASAQAANDALNDDSFDAVITDWDLGMASIADGDEVVRLIKEDYPDLPVMLWSGLTRPTVEEADRQITKDNTDLLIDWLASL